MPPPGPQAPFAGLVRQLEGSLSPAPLPGEPPLPPHRRPENIYLWLSFCAVRVRIARVDLI